MHQDQDANLRLDRLAGAAAATVRRCFPALVNLTASDNPTRAMQAEDRLRDGAAQWSPRASLPIHPRP